MSDTIQKLIPIDVETKLSKDKINEIVEIILSEDDALDIKVVQYEKLSFIDSGQNFESIACNLCGEEVDMEWWAEKMDLWCDSDELNITTICCKGLTNLNTLKYSFDCGFSFIVIEIYNPNEYIDIVKLNQSLDIELKSLIARI